MAENQQKSDFIDVMGILKEWLKNWYWFVISVLVCIGLGYAYTKIKKPVYEVNANLLIEQSDSSPATMALGNFADLFGGNGYVEDEVFVVGSHSVLREVAKDLQAHKTHYVRDGFLQKHIAYKDFPIEVYTAPELADTLRASFKFRVKADENGDVTVITRIKDKKYSEVEAKGFPVTVETPYGNFVFNKTKDYPKGEAVTSDILFTGYDGAAENLMKDIKVDIASKKSNVIHLEIATQNIDYGKDLLNHIMAKYNVRGKEHKTTQARQTTEFIDSRLTKLAGDLASSEADVQNFKHSHGIIDVETEAEVNLKRREEYDAKVVEAQTQLELLNMTRDFLNRPSNAYSLIPVSDNMQEATKSIESYNELILKRMELEGSAKSNNVAMKSLSEQIDAMRGNILSSINHSISQQRTAVNDLRAQVGDAEARLGKIPSQERQYRDILRQQTVREQLYVYLLERREETAMMAANALAKGLVVDEAYAITEPLGLSKKMVLALAFVLGLIIPPVVLYLRRMLRSKFRTREEVEKLIDVPVLGEVCTSKSAAENPLVVRPQTSSSVAELFRLIRTNLGFMLRNRDGRVVLVTSTKSGEGKSFISINLAASLALLGKRVLLIGMDIRSPKLAEYLGINPRHGLTEYLSTPDMDVNEIIMTNPVAENMDVVVAGPVPPNPSELLCEQVVDDFIAEMRKRYDYVVIDSAPVGMVSDTFSLDRIADATVYVCRANYTHIRDLEFVNTIRRQERLKNLALVVNGTTATSGYGYGYGSRQEDGNSRKKK